MKRFVAVGMLLLFALGGLVSAQFLEENEMTMRGISFNLPSNLLLTIQSGELLIALDAASLATYVKREDVQEGFVVSIAFPEELDQIGLASTTPPKDVITQFKTLLGATADVEAYDTSYGPFPSREAFAVIWTDSRIIAFNLDGVTVAFRVAGQFDRFKDSVNHLIASMKRAAPASGAAASPAPAGEELRQWAARANATSQYGSGSWSAMQATGAPNVGRCGDDGSAWASSSSSGKDSLTLIYETAVFAREIHIFQTYNPGAITSVVVMNSRTGFRQELPDSADPVGNTRCPGVFVVKVGDLSEPVDTVTINLDQTLTSSWNEIDAVELVGVKP